MVESSRIEDLRRRVQRDPASIAFAQLAEELRRAGELQESVETCRAGLALHPSYLSARVTLGRALLELNAIEDAAHELTIVLKNAPENLAAMRALGEVYLRRGNESEALAQFRAALVIARNDPDLAETVADLARKLEPKRPSASAEGLTQSEFLRHLPGAPIAPAAIVPAPDVVETSPDAPPDPEPGAAPMAVEGSSPPDVSPENPERDRLHRTVVALEGWLDAIHVARTDRRP